MDLTPALLNGTGVVGLLVLQFILLSTGWILTRREGNSIIKRAESAEKARDALIAQNSELIELARLGQSVFTALHEGAKD